MAIDERGRPDDLRRRLTNWLNQANDPIGTLPAGVTPVEWAVRNFVDTWHGPLRTALRSIDRSLETALTALSAGDTSTAIFELECARQALAEDVRDELGIDDWDGEGE